MTGETMTGETMTGETMTKLWAACWNLALVGVLTASVSSGCKDGSTARACSPETCPAGCCDGDRCVNPGPTACGIGGAACVDCTASAETDACLADTGECVCMGAGARCPSGWVCGQSGCSDCTPDCAGKCAGADDGCGGTCAVNDCPGCCDASLRCVHSSDQTDTQCGSGGGACTDCTASAETDACLADTGECVCMGAGARCPSGWVCGQSGCSDCTPDCAGKCAGADDGCGGTCAANDCSGCCDENLQCVPPGSQSSARCGAGGEACADCGLWGFSCDPSAHVCLSSITDHAWFVSQSVPARVQPGQTFTATLTFRNTGTSTWTEAQGYRLGAQNPQDNGTWGLGRVLLDAADSIAPGQTKTFTVQATASSSPGLTNFQWRMLREGHAWFGRYSVYQPVLVGTAPVTVCEALRPLAGTGTDAAPALQACIDAAAPGDVVELPAGLYRVDHAILVMAHGVTLRTEGMDISHPPCLPIGHACAELRASTAFGDTGGILQVLAPGSRVDHLVINGNKAARTSTASGQQCGAGSNAFGYNMRIGGSHCALTNSASIEALCGTGCEISGAGDHVVLWRNTIAQNGVHNAQGMWSDGITAHDYSDTTIAGNEIYDNTDVDLIFGGCPRCMISDNVLWHSTAFESGSFAALMLHAWPNGATSGDFTGAVTTGNTIDCSSDHRCGFGLYLGADAWYITDSFGGEVHGNVVRNAAQGVLLDDVHDMAVWDNPVRTPASSTHASCGTRATSAYGIGTRSVQVDFSRESMGTTYTPVDWDLCIPNWWQ